MRISLLSLYRDDYYNREGEDDDDGGNFEPQSMKMVKLKSLLQTT